MRTHVYIRKQNEQYWETIEDKSGWLNDILDKERVAKEQEDELIFRRMNGQTDQTTEEA